jgi:hypothetical protein
MATRTTPRSTIPLKVDYAVHVHVHGHDPVIPMHHHRGLLAFNRCHSQVASDARLSLRHPPACLLKPSIQKETKRQLAQMLQLAKATQDVMIRTLLLPYRQHCPENIVVPRVAPLPRLTKQPSVTWDRLTSLCQTIFNGLEALTVEATIVTNSKFAQDSGGLSRKNTCGTLGSSSVIIIVPSTLKSTGLVR